MKLAQLMGDTREMDPQRLRIQRRAIGGKALHHEISRDQYLAKMRQEAVNIRGVGQVVTDFDQQRMEFLVIHSHGKSPHGHIVFSLPKIIRSNFLYDRPLLGKLSRCAWECLEFFLKAYCPGDSMPGAVVAIQTFGDPFSFHPHCHILVTDGCFQEKNGFTRTPAFDWEKLEGLFKQKVLRMLLKAGRGRLAQSPKNSLKNWEPGDTLETAIGVLCNLQQQGKLIGGISHVESWKERLPAQIEVFRSGDGCSTFFGPGCRNPGS